MTCVIAHRDGWMVSDSLCDTGTYRNQYEVVKMLSTRNVLLGHAGLASHFFVVEKALERASAYDLGANRVIAIVDEHEPDTDKNEVLAVWLAVTRSRRLLEISAGCIQYFSSGCKWAAIGSGAPVARGYLAARGESAPIDENAALDALRAVSRHVSNVGPPFRLNRFESLT